MFGEKVGQAAQPARINVIYNGSGDVLLVTLHLDFIAVLDWVKYSLSPSQTRYLNENQMKAGEKIRAKIGLLGRLNIK